MPVLRHCIAPGEVADEAVPGYLRPVGITVLANGELAFITTEHRADDGSRIGLPSKWLVAGRT